MKNVKQTHNTALTEELYVTRSNSAPAVSVSLSMLGATTLLEHKLGCVCRIQQGVLGGEGLDSFCRSESLRELGPQGAAR